MRGILAGDRRSHGATRIAPHVNAIGSQDVADRGLSRQTVQVAYLYALAVALLLIVAALASSGAEAQVTKPFALPRDRAAWDGRREALRDQVDAELSRELP